MWPLMIHFSSTLPLLKEKKRQSVLRLSFASVMTDVRNKSQIPSLEYLGIIPSKFAVFPVEQFVYIMEIKQYCLSWASYSKSCEDGHVIIIAVFKLYICVHACLRPVVSDSLLPHGLQLTRLLCLWDSPGKNTGVVCYFILQGIFPTQEQNLHLLHLPHCRQILYR